MGKPERVLAAGIVVAIIACALLTFWPATAPAAAATTPVPLSANESAPADRDFFTLSDSTSVPEAWSVDPGISLDPAAPTTSILVTRLAEAALNTESTLGRGTALSGGVFRLSGGFAADRNGDGNLDESDLADFQDDWAFGDPNADFNADGTIDSLDLVAFVDAFDTQERGTESDESLHLAREVFIQLNRQVHVTEVYYTVSIDSSGE